MKLNRRLPYNISSMFLVHKNISKCIDCNLVLGNYTYMADIKSVLFENVEVVNIPDSLLTFQN